MTKSTSARVSDQGRADLDGRSNSFALETGQLTSSNKADCSHVQFQKPGTAMSQLMPCLLRSVALVIGAASGCDPKQLRNMP